MKYVLLTYALLSLVAAVVYTIGHARQYRLKWYSPKDGLALLVYFAFWWLFIKMTPERQVRLSILIIGFIIGAFFAVAVMFGSAVRW